MFGSVMEIPVLIVGAGPCGLTASLTLSRLGVDHLLVERHAGRPPLPRAADGEATAVVAPPWIEPSGASP